MGWIDGNARGWLTGGVRTAAVLALAFAFTAACVQESGRRGRLASTTNYDDCVYFLDGALLRNAVANDGLTGGWRMFQERAHHSPFSALLASAAFVLLGQHEASPYWMNGLVVLLYLAGLGYLLWPLPTPSWLLVLGIFLTPPFITMGVVEFRPDIAWAVVTGFGVVWMVTREQLFRVPARGAFAGCCMAAALLIKPTTFVLTVLLFSGAAVSRGIPQLAWWQATRARAVEQPGNPASGLLAFGGALLALAGPYWWFFGGDIWAYFWNNSFGVNKAVWAYPGTNAQALLYYLTGEAARSNVGLSGWVLLLGSLASTMFLFVTRAALRWRLAVLLAALLATFTINMLAEMKSPFLGGAIYGLWLFGTAYACAEVYGVLMAAEPSATRTRLLRWSPLLLAVALGLCSFLYRWPQYSDWGADPVRCSNYRSAAAHMATLLEQRTASLPRSILFVQAGPIVKEDIGLWFAARNVPVRLGSAAFDRSEADFATRYPQFEWVVLQELGTLGASPNMPAEPLLPAFTRMVQADTRYRLVLEFAADNGKKVWVFGR